MNYFVQPYSHLMPPPPPPPPPPIPLVLPRIPNTPAKTQVPFANVRANLRHAGMPVEAPINSSFIAKRVGQPTIGVPADEKAGFLNELFAQQKQKNRNDDDDDNGFSTETQSRERVDGARQVLRAYACVMIMIRCFSSVL